MDRDTFIIAVYCVVVEHYQTLTAQRPVRRGGFPPTLSDEEVITMEICGEYFKLPSDKAIWQYFRAHSRSFFPALGDRTPFGRQAATLWQIKAAIPQRLTVTAQVVKTRITLQLATAERLREAETEPLHPVGGPSRCCLISTHMMTPTRNGTRTTTSTIT